MTRPIVITGGGTGGHIFPMLAIAEQLQALGVAKNEIRYVGSRRGQEKDLLSGDIRLTLLPGRGLRRSFSPKALLTNLGAVLSLGAAVLISIINVGIWRPRVIVSVGGYASFSTSLAGALWRIPLVSVELDAIPSASQHYLVKHAALRCTAFDSSMKNCVTTGVPIRTSLETLDRSEQARTQLRQSASPPIKSTNDVVIVMTGSLGAKSVNTAVVELAKLWSSKDSLTLIHVTGRRDFEFVKNSAPVCNGLDYRIIPFGEMNELWALCDVAITRAGAMTIGEVCQLGIPSVLIPLPGSPGDHQTKNAEQVVASGGAVMIRDADLNATLLGGALESILKNKITMGASIASLAKPNAARSIATHVLGVARQ